ncbi:glutamate carboxypeptidase [Glaciihabitans tibetensis]|uniref:Glutamate carboxypeptidase n=1 Tax=Glaciihabitans tibetensis TaxID=1266600 RepID=A0A2T0VAH2_9MICO|nr:M20/M25/M40 family metallo-hydrolase [Glaciihabitans tibetensis]PRY67068.1 glutamate carboxypeptidase [Glaciihabitans tibetensis]
MTNHPDFWVRDAAARDRALARLESYVRQETPTGDRDELVSFVEKLAARYRELGASVTLHHVDGGAHLVADLAGRGAAADTPPILLIGHSDTVWARGTLADEVPWTTDGTRITGPGVYDMKSGLVVIEEALELLRSSGADHRPVRIIVTADEEIGSPSSAELLRSTAVGCSAAIGFESPHPNGDLKCGRLGSTRLKLTVTGVPAHAALDPDKGVSATEEILDQLLAVRAIAARATERAATREDTTVLYNLGSIEAPGLANVVSDGASAVLGFRFSDPEIESEVLGEIEALQVIRPGATLEVTRLSYRPAWKARAADKELAGLIARCAAEAPISGGAAEGERGATAAGLPVGCAPAAGAADTNLLGSSDIAVVDGFGPRGGGAHARSEHIIIDSLWERIPLLAEVLAN